MTFNLFALTHRPAPDLFHRRNDANDPRLGELISVDPVHYRAASCIILGCPQDEGIRRNRGRLGAAEAPSFIRRAFYRLTPFGIDAGDILDLGDTIIQPTLEQTHDLHRRIVSRLLGDGKTVISIGGGNDISYPDVAALASEFTDPLVFNIDAHFDVRADAERNSGTPYRQLLDERLINPSHFCEMGFQPAVNSGIYYEYLRSLGVHLHSLDELHADGVIPVFRRIIDENPAPGIFWGFDLDAVRASDAPGVSAPAAVGLSGEELCWLSRLAGSLAATRLLEFTEVCPRLDLDDRTSRLTALAIHHFLRGRQESRPSTN